MHVYVQKSTSTTFPCRRSGVSGSELSQPVAPSKPGRRVSAPSLAKRLTSGHRPLAQRAESGPQLLGEELRLLPRGEVATPFSLVEVGEAGVDRLDPAARGAPDLAGERREPDGNRNRRRRLSARKRGGQRSCVLPVRPRRRRCRAAQPVQGNVVDDAF